MYRGFGDGRSLADTSRWGPVQSPLGGSDYSLRHNAIVASCGFLRGGQKGGQKGGGTGGVKGGVRSVNYLWIKVLAIWREVSQEIFDISCGFSRSKGGGLVGLKGRFTRTKLPRWSDVSIWNFFRQFCNVYISIRIVAVWVKTVFGVFIHLSFKNKYSFWFLSSQKLVPLHPQN